MRAVRGQACGPGGLHLGRGLWGPQRKRPLSVGFSHGGLAAAGQSWWWLPGLFGGPLWGGRGWMAGSQGPFSPRAGDAVAPLGRETSRAICVAAGWRSPWRLTPSPCSAWPASWPPGSCTCIATTTCTGEAGRGCWLSAAVAPAQRGASFPPGALCEGLAGFLFIRPFGTCCRGIFWNKRQMGVWGVVDTCFCRTLGWPGQAHSRAQGSFSVLGAVRATWRPHTGPCLPLCPCVPESPGGRVGSVLLPPWPWSRKEGAGSPA